MQVKSFINPDELEEDLAFDETTLDDAMVKQASLSSHYGMMASKAALQASLYKTHLKTVEANRYLAIREELKEKGEKFTEALLEKLVATDSTVISANNEYAKAVYQSDIGKVASDAFRQRRDMIVQVSKNVHEEMKGELRIQIADELSRRERDSLKDVMQQ